MWKLNANQTRMRFENRVKGLVSTDVSGYIENFQRWMLNAFDEVYKKKKSRRNRGSVWRLNEKDKDALAAKKAAMQVSIKRK